MNRSIFIIVVISCIVRHIIIGIIVVCIVGTFQLVVAFHLVTVIRTAVILIQELFDLFPTLRVDLDQVHGICRKQFDHP